MIVLLVIGSSEIGGAQKVFINLVSGLKSRGHDVVVALPDGPLVEQMKFLNVENLRINTNSFACIFDIASIISKTRFDIINVHLTKCSILVSLVNLIYHIPICCTIHNDIIHEKTGILRRRLYPLLYYGLYKICDGIIAVSEYGKKNMVELAKIEADFVRVIYNGIDITEAKEKLSSKCNKDIFVIGVIGRLSPEKGHRYLIDALMYLDDINYECIIVGDGSYRTELEYQTSKNKLNAKVKFLSFINPISSIISKMDVIVVPSLNETFGISIVEAFIHKKPVIASNVGGIPELVKHNLTGFLFPARDVMALADNIKYVYYHRDEAVIIAENAFKYAMTNFTSSIMTENSIAYFIDIIKRKNGHGEAYHESNPH